MKIYRVLGSNYVKVHDEWLEVEDLPLTAKIIRFATCDRCGAKRATKNLTRVDAPVCVSDRTVTLCKTCLGLAFTSGQIVNGRFRLRGICTDHYHPSQEG